MSGKLLKYSIEIFILLIISIVTSGGAMSEQTPQFSNIKDIPESAWKTLAEKKIYFGHQSVGFNILAGIGDIMANNPLIKLNIVETDEPEDFENPLFAHSTVGSNTKPKSKIDAFANILEKGIGEQADIAFFKFCYIDFHSNTNIEEVFNQYKDTIFLLKEKFPQVKLVHSTVPLTSQQTGPKAWVKKILRKPLRGYEGNITRNQFNELLRTEYEGKDPIFDLAKMESTFPDGERSSFTKDGTTYYSMVQDYTDDGGHLNETGRKVVAEQLLIFLANILE
jgi:hypothetical protein